MLQYIVDHNYGVDWGAMQQVPGCCGSRGRRWARWELVEKLGQGMYSLFHLALWK